MKTRDKAMFFWGAAASAEAIALEWLFIRLALKVTTQFPEGLFAWFFPLVLFPALLAVVLVNFRKLQSRAQRLLELRYLALSIPSILCPVAAALYGNMWLQLSVILAA